MKRPRSIWIAAALLLVWAGCSSGPQKVGAQPSWRPKTTAAQPAIFEPQGEAVPKYNGPVAAVAATPLSDATITMVNSAAKNANLTAPTADARLFAACEELAAVVPENGVVAYNVVEFAMQRHGIIEPSPHLLVVWGQIDDPAAVVEQLAPRIPEILAAGSTTRLGVGAAKRNPDGTGAVVFALQASNVRTSPMPRALPDGEIAANIRAAKHLVFCFGLKLPNPLAMAPRPRSIGVCELDDRFSVVFLEAPNPAMNVTMQEWVRELEGSKPKPA